MSTKLSGNSWAHVRGLDPMVATAEAYREIEPDLEITWTARSLQDFGSFPVTELAKHFDLMVIDHPHLGDATRSGALVAIDEVADADELAGIRADAVGPSFESYVLDGRTWALPIDTAAQVSAYRPDLIGEGDVPATWDDVIRLAEAGGVLWPVKPIDAVCSFMSLSANRGTPIVDSEGRVMTSEDAGSVLTAMRELAMRIDPRCLSWSPIQALDVLSSQQDAYRYIPLAFAYSNYSRRGFAPHILHAVDMPGLGSTPGGSLLGGAGIAVSSRCPEPAAAVRYALWIASAKVQKGLYVTSGGQPGSGAAWSDATANELTADFFRRVRRTQDGSWLRPRGVGFPRWQDAAGEIIHGFLQGSSSVGEVADRLVESYGRVVGSRGE